MRRKAAEGDFAVRPGAGGHPVLVRSRRRSFARLKAAQVAAQLQEDPLDARALETSGELLFEQGRFRDAISRLGQAAAAAGGKSSPSALVTLGCCLYADDRVSEAAEAFRRAGGAASVVLASSSTDQEQRLVLLRHQQQQQEDEAASPVRRLHPHARSAPVLVASRRVQNCGACDEDALPVRFELDVCAYMARALVFAGDARGALHACVTGAGRATSRTAAALSGPRARFGGAGALNMLAASICAHNLHDLDAALGHLETAHRCGEASLAPYEPEDVWLSVARVYSQLGLPALERRALRCLSQGSTGPVGSAGSVRRHRRRVVPERAWAMLAAKHELQHDFFAAVDALEQALLREPFDAQLLRGQARCLAFTGEQGCEERICELNRLAKEAERAGLSGRGGGFKETASSAADEHAAGSGDEEEEEEEGDGDGAEAENRHKHKLELEYEEFREARNLKRTVGMMMRL